jgi:anti-sigma factor RsiW
MASDHFDLELQDLLDDRLPDAERERVQAHVDRCARCHQELDELRRGRDFARGHAQRVEVPREVEEDLSRLLEARGPGGLHAEAWHGIDVGRRRILTYGLSGLGAAAALFAAVYLGRSDDLPAEAVRSYTTDAGRANRLEVVTSDPGTLERYFESRLPFKTHVFDLGMVNYRLLGGRAAKLGGHDSALYVYQGPGLRLVCHMYQGDLSELAPPDERRFHDDLTFLVYRRGMETAVFWSEGRIICVLVSQLPTEEVLGLAFAKARKPSAGR